MRAPSTKHRYDSPVANCRPVFPGSHRPRSNAPERLVSSSPTDRIISSFAAPRSSTLAADAVAAGVKLNDVLDLIGTLRDELGALAATITQTIIDRIWEPLVAQDRIAEIEPLLRRGRLLLLQGAVSTLADRLGDALMHRADEVPDGDKFRAAIEAIRVGVITDAAGNVRRA